MTIREYISQKFSALGLTEAHYHDVVIGANLSLDEQYTAENENKVGKAMISLIEDLIFSPRQTSISENGFSMSWDFSGLGKWYLSLCRRYGVTPDNDVLAAAGVSVIVDRTANW